MEFRVTSEALAQKAVVSYPDFMDTKIILAPYRMSSKFRFDYIFETILAIFKKVKEQHGAWVNSIHRVYHDGELVGTIAFQKGPGERRGGVPNTRSIGRRAENSWNGIRLVVRDKQRPTRIVGVGAGSVALVDSTRTSPRLSKRDEITVPLESLDGDPISSISVLLTIMQAMIWAARRPKHDIVVSLPYVIDSQTWREISVARHLIEHPPFHQ